MGSRVHLKEKDVYRFLNTGILVCMLLTGAGSNLGIGQSNMVHALVAFGSLLLLEGLHFLTVRGRIVCLGTAAVVLSATVVAAGPEKSFAFSGGWLSWVMGNGGWQEEWVTGYEMLQTVLVAVLAYLFQLLLERFLFLKAGTAGLMLAGLLVCLFREKEVSHAAVVLALCYIVMIGTELVQGRWKKNRKKESKAQMIWITPFMVVYFLILLLLPVPKKPYDWQWMKEMCAQVKETFLTVTQKLFDGEKESFEMTMSGFSENGKLRGNFLADEQEVLTIQGERNLVTNVYLMGTVYDTFDGREWQQKDEVTFLDRLLDTRQTLYSVRKYREMYLKDYIYRTKLHIRYQNFMTAYLFAPLKTESIQREDGNLTFFPKGDSLVFDERKGYGTEYDVTFYQLNVDQEEFYQFLESSTEPDQEEWLEILENYRQETGDKLTLEDVGSYRRRIEDRYLEEPEISVEVAEYLKRMTQNAETDVEKLRAIERELSSLTYTATPGELPGFVTDAGTFLDYFLLENRQGYCTYFATAFVLLARAEGIPARYVQGYCVPMHGEEETTVYSSMAHAWPEAYIEGVGWIPFEPTPGYAGIRYTPWQMRQEAETENIQTGADVGWYQQQETVSQENWEVADQENLEEPELPEHSAAELPGVFWRILGMAVITVAAGFALMLLLEHVIGGCRYRRMDETKKFCAEIAKNRKVLFWLGAVRSEGETLQEFQGRTEQLFTGGGIPEETARELLYFLSDYEEFLYGTKEITVTETISVRRQREELLRFLKGGRPWTYACCIIRLWMMY